MHVPRLRDRLRLASAYPQLYLAARRTAAGRWGRVLLVDEPHRCVTLRVDLGRPVRVTIPLRIDGLMTFDEVFLLEDYRPRRPLPRSDVLVDLGANFGLATCYLVSCLPFSRVLAVEPNPLCRRVLERNLRCRAGMRAELVPAMVAALDDDEGRLALSRNFVLARSADYRYDERPTTRVFDGLPRRRLSTILHDRGISRVDLLKMDVEFAEYDVTGADAEELRRCNCVIAELHGIADQRESLMRDWETAGLDVVDRRHSTLHHEVVEAHRR
jgi:FkbM family methyltransferase